MEKTRYHSYMRLARHNMAELEHINEYSCYYCNQVINHAIDATVDEGKTAICPQCGVDSVLPFILPHEILTSLHRYAFNVDEQL